MSCADSRSDVRRGTQVRIAGKRHIPNTLTFTTQFMNLWYTESVSSMRRNVAPECVIDFGYTPAGIKAVSLMSIQMSMDRGLSLNANDRTRSNSVSVVGGLVMVLSLVSGHTRARAPPTKFGLTSCASRPLDGTQANMSVMKSGLNCRSTQGRLCTLSS